MKLLLKNADLYLPQHIGVNDIFIKNGIISRIAKNMQVKARVIDCKGKKIIPMFVDGHSHISLTGIYNYKDLILSGVGSVVGIMSMVASENDLKKMLKICKRLRVKNIDAYCLTGSFKYMGNIVEDLTLNDSVIGTKTALNSKTKIREESPNYAELCDLAHKTFLAGNKTNKIVQIHIHLESTKANSLEDLYDKMSDLEVGNLFWIDKIVQEKNVPYSIFKLTHSQKYVHKILEYARKGCYIDYTAMKDSYDKRFDDLIEAIKSGTVDTSKLSISSDMGAFGLERNQTKSLLNTLKLFVSKGLSLDDVLPLFTTNPGCLITNSCGKIEEGKSCKLLIMDDNLEIITIVNGKKLYKVKNNRKKL